MDRARTCLQNHDNMCAIRALEGHAQSEPELAMLALAYRALGDRANAVRTMRRYLQRFPNGPRSDQFRAYIAE